MQAILTVYVYFQYFFHVVRLIYKIKIKNSSSGRDRVINKPKQIKYPTTLEALMRVIVMNVQMVPIK